MNHAEANKELVPLIAVIIIGLRNIFAYRIQ